MTCRHVGQMLDSFVEGGLSSSMLAEVHAHLLQCPACQQQVEMLRACEDVISHDQSEPELSPGFADRVLSAVPAIPTMRRDGLLPLETRRQRRLRFVRSFVRATMPAAAAVLFFSVVIWPPARVPTLVLSGNVVASPEAVSSPVKEAVRTVEDAGNDVKMIVSLSEPATKVDHAVKAAAQLVETPVSDHAAPGGREEFSSLQFLWKPFGEMLQPLVPESQPEGEDEDIVRF